MPFAILLISFYIFSQFFLLGGVCTKVYAYMFGSKRKTMVNEN